MWAQDRKVRWQVEELLDHSLYEIIQYENLCCIIIIIIL